MTETAEERVERLRAQREQLRASGSDDPSDLDAQIAEAEGHSLTGDGSPRD